ncbi:MAG: 2-oxo acid dehydrogenase subunit E2 [Chloroflexaceae bacterium]|nr:2-oxo acid dehydrogenase subunit E2 [Chloroflexaceae bacterium]
MPTELKLPQLSESLQEGTISRWYRREGEYVAAFDPLLEVETDKVTTDISAPASGTILKILVPEGTTVKVGTLLVLIGPPAEAASPPPAAPTPADAPPVPAPIAAQPSLPHVSPVAAKVAAELGVDLTQVRGTAPGGRITRQDVLDYAHAQQSVQQPAPPSVGLAPISDPPDTFDPATIITPAVSRLAAQHNLDLRLLRGTGRGGRITRADVLAAVALTPPAPPAPVAVPSAAPPPAVRLAAGSIPVTGMRRAIAVHMVQSVATSPHVTTVMEVDFSAVAAHRRAQRAAFAARGLRLTYTAYVVAVVAQALQQHPLANARWAETEIVLNAAVHIGVATALDTTGLIVPVIRHADELSLAGLARQIEDLAQRARAGTLTPEDVGGGTFTITNHGTSGSLWSTPIIHQPQSAILGVGVIEERVKVIGGMLAIRPMAYLSLSFDHRVLDGAGADAFLASVQAGLAGWAG